MIFKVELNNNKKLETKPQEYINIKDFGKEIGDSANEKSLEELIAAMIKREEIFQNYMVIGTERFYQPEADIYAVNEDGDLVLFELKVDGNYDRGKVLQVMNYAANYSRWDYEKMNEFYKKYNKNDEDLYDNFIEKFPEGVSTNKFNRKQKMIIISNSSDKSISSSISYWQSQGINIEEYFYRFYRIGDEYLLEISNDNFANENSQDCWINTNKTYFSKAMKEMIKEKKASAHGDRKNVITEVMKGGYIFLYHNGKGIIAAGKATGKPIEFYNENLGVDEKKIKLKNFIHGCDENYEIKKYITPQQLKEKLGRNFYFANTKVTLSEKEAKELYKICKEEFI